jgi:cytochrome d ubiquinol oxidase subunit II
VEAAAGASSTLWALVVTFGLAAVTVLPALAYLFWVTQRDVPLGEP